MKSRLSLTVALVSVLAGLLVTPTAEAAERTGGYAFNITINLKSAIPANQKIWCHVSHYRFMGNNASFATDATVVAKRSGSKATCVAVVYFDWPNTDYLPTQTITISSFGPKDAATGLQEGKQQVIALANTITPADGKSAAIKVSTDF